MLDYRSNGPFFGGNKVCSDIARAGLTWVEDPGIGYYPVRDPVYDRAYWDNYVERSRTPIGHALNDARKALVARHFRSGLLVDIGIGCGQFVASMAGAKGFDVNQVGIEWLLKRGAWCDPYGRTIDAACCWDSIEHIQDPARLLANVDDFVFVSVPIFRDFAHLMVSKHRKYDEHYWYFTHNGFVQFMHAHGFRLLESNDMESALGREDIGTYVFARASA